MKKRDKMQNFDHYICTLIMIFALISGCATPAVQVSRSLEPLPAVQVSRSFEPSDAKERVFPGFTAVIAREGDTLSSLAGQYLNDPNM